MHSKPFGTIAVSPRVAEHLSPACSCPFPGQGRDGHPCAGQGTRPRPQPLTPRAWVAVAARCPCLCLGHAEPRSHGCLFVFPLDALQTRSRFPGGGCLGRDEGDDFLQGTIRGRCPPSRVVFSTVRIRGDELPVAAVNRCEHLVIKSPALIPGSRAKQLRGPASKSRSQLLKP